MDVVCYRAPGDSQLAYASPNVCNETAVEGGFYSCCAQGDICLPNNICHFTHAQAGTSGYYAASCTDPTFSDLSCSQQCLDLPQPDIVYNSSSFLWACCGSDCANPTNDTFQAPAPEVLLKSTVALLTVTPTFVSSTSAPTSSSTSTTTTTTTAALSSNSDSASRNAAIGLGAAVGVLLLALIAAGFLILRGRSKNRRTAVQPMAASATDPSGYNMGDMQSRPKEYIEAGNYPYSIASRQNVQRQELQS